VVDEVQYRGRAFENFMGFDWNSSPAICRAAGTVELDLLPRFGRRARARTRRATFGAEAQSSPSLSMFSDMVSESA
jgi:hypothetical protein